VLLSTTIAADLPEYESAKEPKNGPPYHSALLPVRGAWVLAGTAAKGPLGVARVGSRGLEGSRERGGSPMTDRRLALSGSSSRVGKH
jgi:hypothetical protein